MLRPKKPSTKAGTNVNSIPSSKELNLSSNKQIIIQEDKKTDALSPSFVKLSRRGAVVPVFKEKYLHNSISCGMVSCKSCTLCSLTNFPIIIPDTNIFLHEFDMLSHKSNTSILLLQTVLDELQNKNLGFYERLRSLIRSEPNRFFVFTNETFKETVVERISKESANDRNDRAIRVAAIWYLNHIKKSTTGINSKVILLTNDIRNRDLAKAEGIDARSVLSYINDSVLFPSNIISELFDLLRISDETKSPLDNDILYENYLETDSILIGLENGSYYRGLLHISLYNIQEGSIVASVNGISCTIYISGMNNLNRSLNGDTVAVQLLDSFIPPLDTVTMDDIDPFSQLEDARDVAIVERISQKLTDEKSIIYGKVVGIISKPDRKICGSFIPQENPSPEWFFFRPVDKRYPCTLVRSSQSLVSLLPYRVKISIDGWPTTSKWPRGHLLTRIGLAGDVDIETKVILYENEIPFNPFSDKILSCLPEVSGKELPQECFEEFSGSSRLDLRSLCVCSIDPPGCTDIDDALHAVVMPNGNIQVGIHIADVGHFVKQGTLLDTEAANRGTTVYLTDRRIDMLPEVLGSSMIIFFSFVDLCSLMSGVDRFALSCLVEMTEKAEIKNVSFSKTLIRSTASFTYAQAQAIIDEGLSQKSTISINPSINEYGDINSLSSMDKIESSHPHYLTITDDMKSQKTFIEEKQGNSFVFIDNEGINNGMKTLPISTELRNGILLLNSLAQTLRTKRMAAGALTLASSEIRFEFEENNLKTKGIPTGVMLKSILPANALVEEFMLLANIEAAKLIYANFPDQALLRRHPSPPANNFSWLQSALMAIGLEPLDTSSSKRLGETLDAMDDILSSRFSTSISNESSLLRLITTRAMMQAVYFSSGSCSSQVDFWHYGLATPIYTHFTSPIRRYSDIIVHRLITLSLSLEDSSSSITKALSRIDLERLCRLLNHRHRRAQIASRSSIDFFTSIYLQRQGETDKILTANVVRVAQNGLVLLLQNFGIEVFLRFILTENNHVKKCAISDEQNNDIIRSNNSRSNSANIPTLRKGHSSDLIHSPILLPDNPKTEKNNYSHMVYYDPDSMAWRCYSNDDILVQIFNSIKVKLQLLRCPKTLTYKLSVIWIDPPALMKPFLSYDYDLVNSTNCQVSNTLLPFHEQDNICINDGKMKKLRC